MIRKVNIGFDIGITSVGWCIVDEENNIIDRGVRLFDSLTEDGELTNQIRRRKRSARRMISRRKNRKDDFIKLITGKYFDIFGIGKIETSNDLKTNFLATKENFINIVIGKNTNDSVLDMILTGLKQEIKPLVLARVLYYYLSHRGFSYISEKEWEKQKIVFRAFSQQPEYKDFISWYSENIINKNKEKELEKEIEEKAKKLNFEDIGIKSWKSLQSEVKDFIKQKDYLNKFPSEIQKIEFEKFKFLRGNTINNSFSMHDWKKEIEKLFSNQSYLSEKFIKDYMKLFTRLRDFSEGPGSEKSPTNYGLYRVNENGEVVREKENLWDWTIGECSVYVEEDRANKKSCSAELSDLLNQLNIIEINNNSRDDNKLTSHEKKEIIFNVISTKKPNPLKIISEVCNVNINDIYKFPTITKKDNNIENIDFENLNNTRKLFFILSNEYKIDDYDSLIANRQFFNDIVDIFAKFPKQIEKIEENLIKKFSMKDEIIKKIIFEKLDSTLTSSMSYKALNKYIDEEIRNNGWSLNQKYRKIIEKNIIDKFDFDPNSKYINPNCLDNEAFLLSPTTRHSFREVLKVFNKIIKRFIYSKSNHTNEQFHIKNIIIEMPTEKNPPSKKSKISKLQKKERNNREKIKEIYKYDGNNPEIIDKLVLLHSQEGIDIYSREILEPEKVINNPNYCQIDHIIPWKTSYDDSLSNKVLVSNSTNQEKKKRTPKEYLGMNFLNKKKKWEETFKKNDKKFENLCSNISSTDFRQNLGFVGRNLSDTRNICRYIKKAFSSWLSNELIKSKLSNDEINILTVNGSYTQHFRIEKYLNIPKNRDEDYSHHAVDATICAILGNIEDIGKLIFFRKINLKTGEIELKNKFLDFSKKIRMQRIKDINWDKLSNSVKNDNIKFSYKISKKKRFGNFWGDTIISVSKIGNYKYKKLKLLDEKNIEKIFEQANKYYANDKKYPDPKLWNDLLSAFNQGMQIKKSNSEFEKENPFKLYMQEYCKINNLDDYNKYNNSVLLRRKSPDGSFYEYSVKVIKYDPEVIKSYYPVKIKTNDKKSIGAFTKFRWKEIRLFKDKKDNYKIIPMNIALYKNGMKNIINKEKYEKKLKENNIINPKYFLIHNGTIMVSKKDSKDIRRVVGGNFNKNRLELRRIYKPYCPEDRFREPINVIMEKFDFATIDELGNLEVINIDL